MQTSSTSSPDLFDRLRRQHPDLAINVYAMTPGGAVTLEVITPDGAPFTWQAETLELAIAMAFPENAEPTCPNTGLPCIPGCTRKTCAGLHVPLNEWPEPTEPPDTGSIFD